MKNWIIALICLVGLNGCVQNDIEINTLPDLTFQHLPKLSLDVAEIKLVDRSRRSTQGKHIEHMMPTSPKQALRNWVNNRFQATGKSGVATFIVNDASTIEQKLKKETGFTGLFKNDQSEKYITNVDVRTEVMGPLNKILGYANAKATRHITVAENVSLLEREKAWFNMVETTMGDFDKTIIENLKSQGLVQ